MFSTQRRGAVWNSCWRNLTFRLWKKWKKWGKNGSKTESKPCRKKIKPKPKLSKQSKLSKTESNSPWFKYVRIEPQTESELRQKLESESEKCPLLLISVMLRFRRKPFEIFGGVTWHIDFFDPSNGLIKLPTSKKSLRCRSWKKNLVPHYLKPLFIVKRSFLLVWTDFFTLWALKNPAEKLFMLIHYSNWVKIAKYVLFTLRS